MKRQASRTKCVSEAGGGAGRGGETIGAAGNASIMRRSWGCPPNRPRCGRRASPRLHRTTEGRAKRTTPYGEGPCRTVDARNPGFVAWCTTGTCSRTSECFSARSRSPEAAVAVIFRGAARSCGHHGGLRERSFQVGVRRGEAAKHQGRSIVRSDTSGVPE